MPRDGKSPVRGSAGTGARALNPSLIKTCPPYQNLYRALRPRGTVTRRSRHFRGGLFARRDLSVSQEFLVPRRGFISFVRLVFLGLSWFSYRQTMRDETVRENIPLSLGLSFGFTFRISRDNCAVIIQQELLFVVIVSR